MCNNVLSCIYIISMKCILVLVCWRWCLVRYTLIWSLLSGLIHWHRGDPKKVTLTKKQIWKMIINTLRPRQNGRHFADDIFKCIFLNENIWIPIKISVKFVPKGPINNIPALVQIMAWRRPGDKPLSELMMVSLTTHICVTRPQWVKQNTFNDEWWIYVHSVERLLHICIYTHIYIYIINSVMSMSITSCVMSHRPDNIHLNMDQTSIRQLHAE